MMKQILLLSLLILIPSISLALTNKQLATSINLAGKQRMLSQKMLKEALLIKREIDVAKNLTQLQQSQTEFSKTLKGLILGDSTLKLEKCQDKEIQKQLQVVHKIWQTLYHDIESTLQKKATTKTYNDMQKLGTSLLKEMNAAVSLYVAQSKKKNSKRAQAINLSGKERMLTQKIATQLLIGTTQEKDIQLFEQILTGLQEGDKRLNLEKTQLPNIKNALTKAQKLWHNIKVNLQHKNIQKTINSLDTLRMEMDKIVKLFEKSIQKEKQALALSSLVKEFMQTKHTQNHTLNLAGKQRMLTQEMSKLALLISLNIAKDKNKKTLSQRASDYTQTLKGLAEGDDTKVKETLKKLEKRWITFHQHIKTILKSDTQNLQALSYIIKHNETLLKLSNELVQHLKLTQTKQTFLEKSRANIVDIAGRQRMLTQKMTKEKLLIIAKVNPLKNEKKLHKTVALFEEALKALQHGDKQQNIIKASNKNMIKKLQKVSSIWYALKPIYLKKSLTKQEQQRIIKENMLLLSQMNEAVSLSETIADY